MVTTENIPGDNRAVSLFRVAWSSGDSMSKAISSLQKWAAENDFDSIIGIRFEFVNILTERNPGVHSTLIPYNSWTVYGTCLRHKAND